MPARSALTAARVLLSRSDIMADKIENYGLIGNMQTAALVSRSGSIDWLCAPHFDSDACFTSIVGYDEHGRWSIRPGAAVRETRQRYRGDTMILETEFTCDGGVVRITDAMPVNAGPCDVIRIIEGVEGELPVEISSTFASATVPMHRRSAPKETACISWPGRTRWWFARPSSS